LSQKDIFNKKNFITSWQQFGGQFQIKVCLTICYYIHIASSEKFHTKRLMTLSIVIVY